MVHCWNLVSVVALPLLLSYLPWDIPFLQPCLAPLKAVSFNTFFLPSPVSHVDLRAAPVIRALSRLDADIMCLQEVWLAEHRDTLIAALKSVFPYSAFIPPEHDQKCSKACTKQELLPLIQCVSHNCSSSTTSLLECGALYCGKEATSISQICGVCVWEAFHYAPTQVANICLGYEEGTDEAMKNCFGFGGSYGVVVLSKWPLDDVSYLRYSTSTISKRGAVYAKFQPSQRNTPVHTFCTHFSSNNTDPHPNTTLDWPSENKHQVVELMNFIKAKNIPSDQLTLLLGDLNIGPEIASKAEGELPENYALIEAAGFVNPMLQQNPDCSFCTSNHLVVGQGYKASMLIDHIMYRDTEANIHVKNELIFKDSVEFSDQLCAPLSDHYGVQATIC